MHQKSTVSWVVNCALEHGINCILDELGVNLVARKATLRMEKRCHTE